MGFQFSREGLVVKLSCQGDLTFRIHRQDSFLSVDHVQDSQVDKVLSHDIRVVDFANIQKLAIWLCIITATGPLFSALSVL